MPANGSAGRILQEQQLWRTQAYSGQFIYIISENGDAHRAATRAENDSGFTKRFLKEVEWVAVARDVKLAQDIPDQRTVSFVDTVAAPRHRRAQRIGGKSDVGWSRQKLMG